MSELIVERRLDAVSGGEDLRRVKAAFDALDPDSGTGPTLLLTRCLPTAAFTRRDALLPGYAAACDAALARGYEPVLRPVGGHLAAHHEGCVVLHLWQPMRQAGDGITSRFADYGRAIADALTSLGVADVRVGPVPGEYCDGEWSVNVAGRRKLVGTGQRISRNGYLFSAVITVTGEERLREVLVDAYARLAIELDPVTVGSVAAGAPGVGVDDVAAAVEDALRGSVGNAMRTSD